MRTAGPRSTAVRAALAFLGLGLILYGALARRDPAAPAQPLRTALAVRTLAGDGAPGVVDGPGPRARFADPFGLAAGPDGAVYVADAGESNRLRRILPTGLVSTLAGGTEGFVDGLGPAAQFHTPSGLARDGQGDLYVADTGNHAIRKVSPAGLVSTLAGLGTPGFHDGPAAEALFDGPIGVAVGPDGSVYVADSYNDRIRKIAPGGVVSTVAGQGTPGYADGPGASARFDTPSGLAVGPHGDLFVADTGNDAVRRIDRDGIVTTFGYGPLHPGAAPSLDRPLGITVAPDGFVYVSDRRGFVVSFSPEGEAVRLAGTGLGFADGEAAAARFTGPAGLVIDPSGALLVADAGNYLIRRVAPAGRRRSGPGVALAGVGGLSGLLHSPQIPRLTPDTLGIVSLPWPIAPQSIWHELAGTMGEPRGSLGGDGRARFHAGIDVTGDYGATVRAVRDEKVQGPLAAAGFGEAGETIAVDLLSYTHLRVGRDTRDRPIDPDRFEIVQDHSGRPTRVRVRRGTRLREGDALGTINRMNHTHLDLGPRGAELNPLGLRPAGLRDHVAPTIVPGGVRLYDPAGRPFARGGDGRVAVSGAVSIVVEAYDQVDDNLPRRRLGLFELGYQVLNRDGTRARGFAEPRMTLRFDRLPPDPDAPLLTYAEGSGITVYGSPVTRFLYIATNTVRADRVAPGAWDAAALEPGEYILRIIAADYAGNVAIEHRDVPVTIREPERR
jgi:streptogramin lyase